MIKYISKDKLIIRESMKMAFMGGEIWFEQLDALSVHTDIVTNKFINDLSHIRKISTPSRIAINLNETLVNEELADLLVTKLAESSKYITKLAFVGLDMSGKRLVKKKFKNINFSFAVNYINDYEKAKIWLMTENY